MRGPTHTMVSCDQPHEQEVVSSWMPRSVEEPQGSYQQFCPAAAQTYIGNPQPTSSPVWHSAGLNYEAQYITAPLDQRIQWLGWEACIIQSVYGGKYTDSISGLENVAERPSAFGNCAFGYLVPPTFANVNCTEPHEVEILGRAAGFVPDDPARSDFNLPLAPTATLDAQCQQLAVHLLAVTDPSYDGRVVIETRYGTTTNEEFQADSDIPDSGEIEISIGATPVAGTSQHATCLARASHLGILTDSLIGNGNKPLPIQ